QCGIDLTAGGLKDGGSVIDDRVDSGDVNEHREEDADHQRAADTGAEQRAPGALAGMYGGGDLGELGARGGRSADAFEHDEGRILFACEGKETGRFGGEQNEYQEDR